MGTFLFTLFVAGFFYWLGYDNGYDNGWFDGSKRYGPR